MAGIHGRHSMKIKLGQGCHAGHDRDCMASYAGHAMQDSCVRV